MNIEGDFRYVDLGAFDECIDFVDYLDEYEGNWDDAFIGWNSATKQWKDKRISGSRWIPWNFVKVYTSSFFKKSKCLLVLHELESIKI